MRPLQPSYTNGFAPRDFASAAPNIWAGCVGAYAPLLGPTGGSLFDWSGLKCHGALSGATLANSWTPQSGYYAFDGNGSSSYVSVSHSAAQMPSDRVTVAAWVCYDSLPAVNSGLVVKSNFASDGYALYSLSTQTRWLCVFGGAATVLFGNTAIAAGNLYHLCGTYDGAALRLFLNGREDASQAKTGAISASSTALTIGAMYGGASGFIDGRILEAAVWNRALTPAEILKLAERPGVMYQPRRKRYRGAQASAGAAKPPIYHLVGSAM